MLKFKSNIRKPRVNFDIKIFDIKKIDDRSCVLIIGKNKKKSQKLLKNIIHNKKDIPTGILISPEETKKNFFSNFIPKKLIYEKYSLEILNNVIKRQKRLRIRINNGETYIDNRCFLIMEDYPYNETDYKKYIALREIMINGSCYSIFLTLTINSPKNLKQSFRYYNIDYLFIFNYKDEEYLRNIYDIIRNIIPTFELFCSFVKKYTTNSKCLVIDATDYSDKLENKVFWYKPESHENFRACHITEWQDQ